MKIAQYIFLVFLISLVSYVAQAEVSYGKSLYAEEFPVGNMLAWVTEFEDNSDLFFIERSEDGINFSGIGQLEAAGFSEEDKRYHFMDIGVRAESSYYRLKQTDKDGTTSYSHIVTVKKVLSNNFMVVKMNTTDVTNTFEVTIDNLEAGQMNYSLIDLRNEVVFAESKDLEPGINRLVIDTEDLSKGIYKVNLQMEEELETLVIQKIEKGEKPVLRASKGKSNAGG